MKLEGIKPGIYRLTINAKNPRMSRVRLFHGPKFYLDEYDTKPDALGLFQEHMRFCDKDAEGNYTCLMRVDVYALGMENPGEAHEQGFMEQMARALELSVRLQEADFEKAA